ncbi:MAG: ABC-type transport system involved in multi-copper enzyme maturation permease subunit [Verrucomicrobiales bacterium]|jgi:ABC-type transport system involved in multi-copper enzyme maturation permease subunit
MLFGANLADFPERLDPMTVKELRQGLRARKFAFPFIIIHIVMIISSAVEYLLVTGQTESAIFFDMDADWIVQHGILFWGVAYFVLLFVMPSMRFFDIQQEYQGRNAELLLLSGLSRWKIVKGKWITSCALSGLIFVSILPYMLLRYFLGGFELVDHLLIAFGLLLNNAVFTAMVIGASAYRNTLGRIVLVGASVVVLSITMIAPLFFGLGLLQSPGGIISVAMVVMVFVNLAGAAVFFSVAGMQLARVKLRTFEDPYDPAPGSQVVILYLFAPLLIGIPAFITFGIGGIVASGFFTWIALNIDPPPKKGKRAFYAQH